MIYRFQVFMIYEIFLRWSLNVEIYSFIQMGSGSLGPWYHQPTHSEPYNTLVQTVKEIWDFLWHIYRGEKLTAIC